MKYSTYYSIATASILMAVLTTLELAGADDAKVLSEGDTVSSGRWVKLHEQEPEDAVRFRRQPHGGSCYDSKRGKLILFGSDTHGRDWTNSPLVFDVERRSWSRVYLDDDPATYAVNADGIAVAGRRGDHPWAMHTFGTVMFDPSRDEMIVACGPLHMIPGRFTDAVKDQWSKIEKFPTWTFDLKTNHWRPLACEAIDFFPHSAAFDVDRNVALGYRPDGIYELAGSPRAWRRLTKKVFLGGWHSNCVYDSKNKALVVFGTNSNSNDIEVFFPATNAHQLMPTKGVRPPQDQHNPMAFHPGIGKTIVLVDNIQGGRQAVTETWLYDLKKDDWSQMRSATLPFGCAMNYNLEYDSRRDQMLLVTGGSRTSTTVWSLRMPQ
ncbi:MAG: hypothetical protein ACI9HK_003487 [Pirellulaceae bacterium]|jgi:hypothetical protein